MPRFFTDRVDGSTAVIDGDDARHLLKSLRVRPGERLTVCDMQGGDYLCEVAELTDSEVRLTVLERRENETEPALRITLYQALPKADKLEFIVQKAVELGAARVVPVQTGYCVARADAASFQKKRGRCERIALEAAKQCGRGIIPSVGDILSFEQAVAEMRGGKSLVFYEGGGCRVGELVAPGDREVSVFIGSEGGFSGEEIAACEAAGIRRATLGKRILRCETAPIAALTLLLSAAGEL